MAGNALFRALRLLMLIPFLGAMGYGLLMTKFSQEMQSGEAGFATEMVLKVGALWLDNRAEKKRDLVFDTAALNDERVVILSRRVALTDLPGGADGTLSGPRAEIAALAVAKQVAEAECANMIKSFALSCRFSTAGVSIGDSGTARLEIALSFAGAAPAGKIEGIEGSSLVPQRVRLTESESSREGYEVSVAKLPTERDKIYAAAEAACAALRAEKGSCVVSELRITEEPAENGKVRLAGLAEIAYLGTRVSASEIADLTTREVNGQESLLSLAMKAMVPAPRAAAEEGTSEDSLVQPDATPADAKSLLDGAQMPSFKDTKGGAKFVTAP